jgi:hypothetical protein
MTTNRSTRDNIGADDERATPPPAGETTPAFKDRVRGFDAGWLLTPPKARNWLVTFQDPSEGGSDEERKRRRRGLIARGELHVLAGEGGVGKGRFAVQLGLAIAAQAGAPKPFVSRMNLDVHPTGAEDKVLFLVGEDDEHEMQLRAFGAHSVEGYDENARRRIAANARWRSFRGERFSISNPSDAAAGIEATSADLQRLCAYLDEEGPFSFVVMDPLARFLGGVNENDNAILHAISAQLEAMCKANGNPAVALVAHTKKPDTSKGASAGGTSQHDVRGASAIVNAARVVVAVVSRTNKLLVDSKGIEEEGAGFSEAAEPREIKEAGVSVVCVKNNLSAKGDSLALDFHVDGGLLVEKDNEKSERRKRQHRNGVKPKEAKRKSDDDGKPVRAFDATRDV